jgi:RNA polymerase sigma factor (sigma-70 family)
VERNMPGSVELTDEIVQAGVAGSRPALRTVVQLIAPQIRLMVAARLSSARDRGNAVDEVTQRVLLALLEGVSRLERQTVGGLKGFLSAIVSRKAADYICMRRESKGRSDTVSLDHWRGPGVDDDLMDCVLSASDTTPGRAAERTEQVQRMLVALDELRPNYREVVTLAFFDQLSVSEIAERLGVSRPAASMTLMRAVNALRELLRESQSGESLNA